MNIIYYLNSNCLYKFYYYYKFNYSILSNEKDIESGNIRITCQYTSTKEQIEGTVYGIGRIEFDNEHFPK